MSDAHVQSLVDNSADAREDFREYLIEVRDTFRSMWKFGNAKRINRILRNKRLFEKVYQKSLKAGAMVFVDTVNSSEFGDGEFLKWFFGWLEDGGWEVIFGIIKDLLPLFGLSSTQVMTVVVAALIIV